MVKQDDVTSSATECVTLSADRGSEREPSGTRRIVGEYFDIELVRLGAGERIARTDRSMVTEEVAAVLEGTVHVKSAEEAYVLSKGEGIIIPPGQGSCWYAPNGGLIYRVLVRGKLPAAEQPGSQQ